MIMLKRPLMTMRLKEALDCWHGNGNGDDSDDDDDSDDAAFDDNEIKEVHTASDEILLEGSQPCHAFLFPSASSWSPSSSSSSSS